MAMLAVLPGCGALAPRDEASGDEAFSGGGFAAYAERVFRYHNHVVDDLIIATELGADTRGEDTRLVRAEHEMVRACRPLNEAVSARLEGRGIGLWQRLRLPVTVAACERASRHLARLLEPAHVPPRSPM
ncbi:MAG: hypothetical protein RLW61_02485 [Gammaproteobacteria bacterium]